MDDLSTRSTADYHSTKFEKISSSLEPKSYDEIITKLHLQAGEYHCTMQYSQKQKMEEEEGRIA
jgi:hypothetical protein